MQICRAARSLGCRNIEQEVADDPMKEGMARRREVKERSFLLCLVVFSIVYCVFFCV